MGNLENKAHAYIINANASKAKAWVVKNLPNFSVVDMVYQTLGVDQAAEVRSAWQNAHSHPTVYILSWQKATIMAQNALLKVIEEPGFNVVCVLAQANSDEIIDTIISRCQRISVQDANVVDLKKQFTYAHLKTLSAQKRLESIQRKMTGKNAWTAIEVKTWISALIQDVKVPLPAKHNLSRAYKLISVGGQSHKQLAEYAALSLR